MLTAKYAHMAHELAYREYMFDNAVDDEKKAFWDGACTTARQLIHSMQENGAKYPFAYIKSETQYYVVYCVHIGDYRAEVMIEK